MKRNDATRRLLDAVVQLGCEVELTRNGHLKIMLPTGRFVIAPSTPSDHRAYRNALAKVRRELRKVA